MDICPPIGGIYEASTYMFQEVWFLKIIVSPSGSRQKTSCLMILNNWNFGFKRKNGLRLKYVNIQFFSQLGSEVRPLIQRNRIFWIMITASENQMQYDREPRFSAFFIKYKFCLEKLKIWYSWGSDEQWWTELEPQWACRRVLLDASLSSFHSAAPRHYFSWLPLCHWRHLLCYLYLLFWVVIGHFWWHSWSSCGHFPSNFKR